MSPAIRIAGVTKRFRSLQALAGVDLEIGQGEFFGLLGPNGAGKTTLISCLAGLGRPDTGTLEVMGHDVMRDYLLTNDRLGVPSHIRSWLRREVLQVLWRVQPEFLQSAFEAIDRDYGGREAYLREGLGLREAERERLRALYLQD